MKDWKKEILTIPNVLSLFRLLLIPVYILIYLEGNYVLAAGILAVSCLTDMIDGKIARHFNMISTLGKILDPLADKATQFALILCLSVNHPVLWYLVGLFVLKEGFMLIAGGLNLWKGKMLKGALITGKICTTVLFVSLILMVLIPTLNDTAILCICIVDSIFMIVSFVDYAVAYRKKASKFQEVDLIHHNDKKQ